MAEGHQCRISPSILWNLFRSDENVCRPTSRRWLFDILGQRSWPRVRLSATLIAESAHWLKRLGVALWRSRSRKWRAGPRTLLAETDHQQMTRYDNGCECI